MWKANVHVEHTEPPSKQHVNIPPIPPLTDRFQLLFNPEEKSQPSISTSILTSLPDPPSYVYPVKQIYQPRPPSQLRPTLLKYPVTCPPWVAREQKRLGHDQYKPRSHPHIPHRAASAIYTGLPIQPKSEQLTVVRNESSRAIYPLSTPPRSASPPTSSSPLNPSYSEHFSCQVDSYDGKQIGLTATKSIRKGTLIIKEAPLIKIPLDHIDEHVTYDHIHQPYSLLPGKKKRIFNSLHKRTDEDAEKDDLVNIVETNSIPLQGDPNQEAKALGIFKTICRVNHSCIPNSGWNLYAYTDIPSGSEITASYIDDVTICTSERQERLLAGYGFECICSACSKTHTQKLKSDTNLSMYNYFKEKWNNSSIKIYAKSLSKALNELDEAWSILKQEKKYDEFGEIYDQFFRVYAVHGKLEELKGMAKKALEHYEVIWGSEKAKRFTDYAKFIEDPTQFMDWGILLTSGNGQKDKKVKKRKI
ncbi:uncharacterized protein L201_008013 [Kwoniella dendrophila CBS 6074]|uniref:SET domain-containing protein n=1 Tax=Kwoniella dendrophila CBS 6074 TaxID=1295534 RepID=A0AAX4K7F0_9TREE